MEINAGSHNCTALSPFHSQVGHHKWDMYIYIYFHSINFSVIDFPSLRMYFPFCFLPGLHLGCAPHDVPLSTIRAIYSTVQYRKDQQEPLGEEQEMQDSLANMVNDLDV